MPTRIFAGAVSISHQWVAQVLKAGMTAVDATAGNGRDTLFLARLVGNNGKVYAFDIQEEALRKTKLLLENHGAFAQVQLIKDSHENLGTYIDETVTVIMFNLGYLPGGNKKIVTRPETTLRALQEGMKILGPRGLIVLTVYTGHYGGEEEWKTLQEFLWELPRQEWDVVRLCFLNRGHHPPFCLGLQRL